MITEVLFVTCEGVRIMQFDQAILFLSSCWNGNISHQHNCSLYDCTWLLVQNQQQATITKKKSIPPVPLLCANSQTL